jgi:hypothetical protein
MSSGRRKTRVKSSVIWASLAKCSRFEAKAPFCPVCIPKALAVKAHTVRDEEGVGALHDS